MVPGRTNGACCNRGSKYLGPTIDSVKWTVEEDAKLTGAVKEHGGNDWAAVAAMVPGRTNKQCHYRWASDPDVNRGKWTSEEDAKLAEAVTEFGSNWAVATVMVPGRTNGQCRQRWIESLDPDDSQHG
jgi:myb proto-oncogene protein